MSRHFFTLILCLLCFSASVVKAQSSLPDSLYRIIGTAPDSLKGKYLYQILRDHIQKSQYARAEALADSILKHAPLEASSSPTLLKGKVYKIWAIASFYQGHPESADTLVAHAITHFERGEHIKELPSCYNIQAAVAGQMRENARAITLYYEALRTAEKIKDSTTMGLVYLNIGTVYIEDNQPERAREETQKGIALFEKIGNPRRAYAGYLTTGRAYHTTGHSEKALEEYAKGLKLAEEIQDPVVTAKYKNNMASIYYDNEDYKNALPYYVDAEKVFRNFDAYSHILILGNIAHSQATLGQKENARYFIQKLHSRIDSTADLGTKEQFFGALARTYEKLGILDSALFYHKAYLKTIQDIHLKSSEEAIAEARVGFDTERKEKEIELLHKNEELQEAEIQRQHTLFVATGVGLLLVVGLLALAYRSNLQRKKANQALQEKNTQIKQQNEEILTINENLKVANAEINQQNEEIEAQAENLREVNLAISEKNNALNVANIRITDSIRYAQTIQEAVLPWEDRISAAFPEFFILFKPLHYVSGDFYWFEEVGSLRIFIVADCTGHGVPGAFMSLLGHSFLTEIIDQEGTFLPGKILEKLNSRVRRALKQGESDNDDGMDALVCVLDAENILTFSGAKRPLLWWDGESIQEKRGTRRHIGGIQPRKERPFDEHEVNLKQGNMLYLTSDGYADQLNAERKKLTSKALKTTLSEVAAASTETQHRVLEERFEAHRKGAAQIDDVTVIGLRI